MVSTEENGIAATASYRDGPRLLADIGVTLVRLALETGPGNISCVKTFTSKDYPGIIEVVRAYLATLDGPAPLHAAIAIANPIDGDQVKMTNSAWQFSIEAVRQALGLRTLLVVNDFTALAMALPRLDATQRSQIGSGEAVPNAVIGLLGAGTGLGVSGLIPIEDQWLTLGSEGGHAGFSPADETELEILRFAWQEFPHVSAERLISGPGMELIYRALAQSAGQTVAPRSVVDICDAALAGDAFCVTVVHRFLAMMGTVASNVALNLGAVGGIYIGAGIVPHLLPLLAASPFRQRFEAKGRFSDYLARIPTYVITAANPALTGVAAILANHLRASGGTVSLLDEIRQAATRLTRAEQQVGAYLLQQPRAFLHDPIADIALAAQVSQPTVIRFCRSLGFDGLSSFKLRLASGLNGAVPIRHSLVSTRDSAHDLAAKVIDNTVSAILKLRESLNPQAVDKAIDLLQNAQRVEFYGVGNSNPVALDAQYKFIRLKIPAVAYSDSRLQAMATAMLGARDVVVIVSSSGRLPELLDAADRALAAGASVIAITASNSPLAKRATVLLAADHNEDSDTHVSMIARLLHLLAVDVLTVGVAVRKMSELAAAPVTKAGNTGDAATFGAIISHIR